MSGGKPYILPMNYSYANPLDTSLHEYNALWCMAVTELAVIYGGFIEDNNNNYNYTNVSKTLFILKEENATIMTSESSSGDTNLYITICIWLRWCLSGAATEKAHIV